MALVLAFSGFAIGALAGSGQGKVSTCEGKTVTPPSKSTKTELVGTPGPDVLVATPGQYVDGKGGNDVICGSSGFDVLRGGPGADHLHGGGGDDVLIGGAGVNVLDGGPGFDTVVADPANPSGQSCQGIEFAPPEAHCAFSGSRDARLPGAADPTSVPCDYWAATTGDDSSPGSFSAPYRTVERLVNTLRPGEVGCLKPGVYTEADDQINVRGHGEPGKPIVLRSQPGKPRAVIRGRLWVCANVSGVTCSSDPRGAHDIVFYGLKFDGNNRLAYARAAALGEPTAALPSPTINGDNITFVDNEVTNENRATCFQVGSTGYGTPDGTRLLFNRIHNCGEFNKFRLQGKGDQAIGVETATNTLIQNNTLTDPTHHDSDMGVFLGPDARKTTILRNTIDGFGRAAVLYAAPGGTLKDNLLTRNIIAHSTFGYTMDGGSDHWQIEGQTFGSPPPPTGNLVTDNCFIFADKPHNIENPSPTFTVGSNPEQLASAPCPDGYGAVVASILDPTLQPVPGKSLIASRRAGNVRVKKAGSRETKPVPLFPAGPVPLGTLVVSSGGTAGIDSAVSQGRNGLFSGSPFLITGDNASLTSVRLLRPGNHTSLQAARSWINTCIASPSSKTCKKACKRHPTKCAQLGIRAKASFSVVTNEVKALSLTAATVTVVETTSRSAVSVQKGKVEVRDAHTGTVLAVLTAGQTYP
jgi:RTX calcium-binding nonapeptide repeat (4 copies)/Right handed beta helix region